MKNLIIVALTCFIVNLQAQKAWIADIENFSPSKECKIMIDISKCDCKRLVGTAEQVYLWTWNPAEDDTRLEGFKNGEWTNSNPNMAMTNEGGDIWSFTLVPTEFYGVAANDVYKKGFSLLAKLSDGTGDGGGGCDEDKTEDLTIAIDPPKGASQVLFGFPQVANVDDVFTLIYNTNIEMKESMANLTNEELFTHVIVTADSVEYTFANFFNVTAIPQLQLKTKGDGIYKLTFIPNEFFTEIIPPGSKIEAMRFSVRKKTYASANDKSDEDLKFNIGCQ